MEIENNRSATNKCASKSSLRLKVTKVTRINAQKYEIEAKELAQSVHHETKNGHNVNEAELIKVVIEGLWCSGPEIRESSTLHLVHPLYDTNNHVYSINNSSGLLVIEPDSLLTCTAVASTLFCERKAWLNHVFLGQVGTNRAMLVGTIVHEVFQYGVKNRIADLDKLIKYLDQLLDDAYVMLDIYSVEMHIKDVRSEAVSYISSVKEWIEKYMLAGPNYPLTNDQDLEVKVIGVSDIEENVWSTKYGLKGKIDVTGAVRVYDKKTKTVSDKTLPLELKTGNPNLSSSHQAQVSLYSMMIEDRYAETNQGLVIYLKDKAAMHNVVLNHNVKRDLIQRRNELNYHMKSYFFGPEMLNQYRMCQKCERLTECLMMSNMYDHDTDRFNNMKMLEKEAIGHLDAKFKLFFVKYHERLVKIMSKRETLNKSGDEAGTKATIGSFWTYSSNDAEVQGIGFGKLQATAHVSDNKNDSSLIKFTRHPKHEGNFIKEDQALKEDKSAVGAQPNPKKLKIDDYFKPKKSVQNNNGPKLKPFDTTDNYSRHRLAISLDEDSTNMDSQNSSTAIAIGFMHELEANHFTIRLSEGALDLAKTDTMYRVDRIEKRTNIDIERIVLVRLMAREDWRCDRIRQIILDVSFVPVENVRLNLFVLETGLEEIKELDGEQQKIVVEAISTDNYYIINEKMLNLNGDDNGTQMVSIDKLVACMTQVIQLLERNVLVVARSIDDLGKLMKLIKIQNNKSFIIVDDNKQSKLRYQYANNFIKLVQDVELTKKFDFYIKQHEKAPVVITTYAMAIKSALFVRRTFDYCILYDCDQIELLTGLGPMFCSDRVIMLDVKKETSEETCKSDDVTLGAHLRHLRCAGAQEKQRQQEEEGEEEEVEEEKG